MKSFRHWSARLVWVILAIAFASSVSAQSPGEAPAREITRVQGDLYRLRVGSQSTVFLVTPDGIILSDPLNRPAALWLQEQLAATFPGRPVRYVLQTHHHFDRAEGASVFLPAAEIVGHQRFNAELSAARTKIPPFLRGLDLNGNGTFERAEVVGLPWAELITSRDQNGDGIVTPSELYTLVQNVKSTFEASRTITLGGSTVRLVHPGAAHAADMTVLYFPAERVVFAVDPPPVSLAPFSFQSLNPRDVVDWIHAVAPLDFDLLLFGNGETMSRAQLVALQDYLDALVSAVEAGYDAGQNLIQLQASVTLDRYRGSLHHPGRSAQIADVFRTLQSFRIDLSAFALTNYGFHDAGFCASYDACSAGGALPAGAVALNVSVGRRVGVGGELTVNGQSWISRGSRLYDEELAFRETTAAALFRFSIVRQRTLAVVLVGGAVWEVDDALGINRVKEAVAPFGGRHSVAAHEVMPGLIVGFDLTRSIGERLGIVVPVRMTHTAGPPLAKWPSGFEVQAGIGLRTSVFGRRH